MEQILLKELHDAKLKATECINRGDFSLAEKYQDIIHELEKSVERLKK